MLLGLYLIDRVLRGMAIWHFFRRRPPLSPGTWPSVSLIQPVTRGTSGLEDALRTRFAQDYPAPVQQILIFDASDPASLMICRSVRAERPEAQIEMIVVPSHQGPIASKITKIRAGLQRAQGEVLCFVDDDVRLRPHALCTFVQFLQAPQAGAVFGVACYVAWDTVWSSMMSIFVNTNALLSYIPLCYLVEPWTITGHCFALTRRNFEAAGGFDAMDNRIDDDHELARRLRLIGLRSVQTPVIYDVRNDLPSLRAYRIQMKRWFVLPRQTMMPTMSQREQMAALVGSAGNLLPPVLGILALIRRQRSDMRRIVVILSVFIACHRLCEQRYLLRSMPLKRWLLVPLIALFAPIEVVLALVSDDQIEWRGQRLYVRRGGVFEVVR